MTIADLYEKYSIDTETIRKFFIENPHLLSETDVKKIENEFVQSVSDKTIMNLCSTYGLSDLEAYNYKFEHPEATNLQILGKLIQAQKKEQDEQFKEALNKVLRKIDKSVLAYCVNKGYKPIREYIKLAHEYYSKHVDMTEEELYKQLDKLYYWNLVKEN